MIPGRVALASICGRCGSIRGPSGDDSGRVWCPSGVSSGSAHDCRLLHSDTCAGAMAYARQLGMRVLDGFQHAPGALARQTARLKKSNPDVLVGCGDQQQAGRELVRAPSEAQDLCRIGAGSTQEKRRSRIDAETLDRPRITPKATCYQPSESAPSRPPFDPESSPNAPGIDPTIDPESAPIRPSIGSAQERPRTDPGWTQSRHRIDAASTQDRPGIVAGWTRDRRRIECVWGGASFRRSLRGPAAAAELGARLGRGSTSARGSALSLWPEVCSAGRSPRKSGVVGPVVCVCVWTRSLLHVSLRLCEKAMFEVPAQSVA